jgi:hypothetical protein
VTAAKWQAERKIIREDWGEAISIGADGRPMSIGDVIARWRSDDDFRDAFIRALAGTGFPAFFWEMPPVARDSLSNAFECAVIRGDALARMQAGEFDFAEHLNETNEEVAAFPNLGGDAMLIVPRRISDADCYGHIASFLRTAPQEQQHALFQRLAFETEKMLAAGRRFWISTSGLGVPWVHVRLDSYPKYYQYRRYAEG